MNSEYIDDLTILNVAELWRRIHPNQIVPDDNIGDYRPSKAAFKDSSMSVQIAEILFSNGLSPSDALKKYPGYSLASITAGQARDLRQGVRRNPLPDDLAHALVFGKKTDSISKKLAKGSKWVILIL
jgi:hypothetical protein